MHVFLVVNVIKDYTVLRNSNSFQPSFSAAELKAGPFLTI